MGAVLAGLVLAVIPLVILYLVVPTAPPGSSRPAEADDEGGWPEEPAPPAHPDFPTPEAAGTQAVFLLEEPPRSPRVEAVEVPDRRGLTATAHAYCELEGNQVICSPALSEPPPGASHHRVERQGSQAVLVEHRRPDGRVAETLVLTRLPDGTALRIARLDEFGALDWVREFSDQGRRYGERLRNGANRLSGCGSVRLEPDDRGRIAALTCLEWSGRPMLDATGVATRRMERDEGGFLRSISNLGLAGEPLADHFGVQRAELERDGNGRVVLEAFRGLDHEPVLSAEQGCAARRTRYSARGLPEELTCLDAAGRPTPGAQGITVERREHDARGCLTLRQFQDPAGAPQADVHGVAGHRFLVDESCLELSDTCLDAAGQPCACGPGRPARLEQRYDARGQLVSVRAYAADGTPGQDAGYGVFEVRLGYDGWGNQVREACYDAAGEPVDCGSTGFHEIVREPDEAGRSVRETFLDSQGRRARNLSTWERRLRYDNYDHLSETRSLDQRGELVESLGLAIRRQLYDRGHRLFGVLLFDAQDRPARYGGCFTGVECPDTAWHAVRVVRATNGRLVKNQYFDARRQLVLELDCARSKCFQ